MGHFAKVVDGKVINVIVAEPEFFETFIDTSPGTWVQTSYNTRGGIHYNSDNQPDGGTPLRKNFAGIGFTYDPVRDAFYEPQPYPSWVLDEDSCCWFAPIPKPDDGKLYRWNEETLSWDLITE